MRSIPRCGRGREKGQRPGGGEGGASLGERREL